MDYQIKITGTATEMAKVFALLSQSNVDSASAAKVQPAADTGATPEAAKEAHSAPKAADDTQPAPVQKAPQLAALDMQTGEIDFPPQDEPPFPTEPEVTVADLQAVGRKLAVAGKGAVVQQVLAKYGVKLISRIPANKRAEALATMQKEV